MKKNTECTKLIRVIQDYRKWHHSIKCIRYSAYEFLLAFHSNYVPIFHCF